MEQVTFLKEGVFESVLLPSSLFLIAEIRSDEARNEIANDKKEVAHSPIDVMGIVEDFGRREDRSIAGRRASPDVKSYLLIAGAHGDVPIVGMYGIFEARQHLLHISCIAH
jgi:hypothetical protein